MLKWAMSVARTILGTKADHLNSKVKTGTTKKLPQWKIGEGERAARDWARDILAHVADEEREAILSAGHAESWRCCIEMMKWDEEEFGPRPDTDRVLDYLFLEAHEWARKGRQIAGCRESLGMTREQLAAKVGVAPQEIESLELGRRLPTEQEWSRLCYALAGATWSPSK